MEKRFITVTSAYSGSKGTRLTLSVDGVQAIMVKKNVTIIKHISHNNGGYEVSETVEQILELIKKSKPI